LTPPVNGTRGFAATIGAAVALGGFVVPAAGIAGSALNGEWMYSYWLEIAAHLSLGVVL